MSTAAKRNFLDVWLVEPNTVYREVPFDVVADWVVQGRLLEGDKTCPAGSKAWAAVGDNPAFAPYLPRPEPLRAASTAEALEPVSLGLDWRRRGEDEDDEVDMIPLIDVSLVLLIFFILGAQGMGAAVFVQSPEAAAAVRVDEPKELWIAIDYKRFDESNPDAARVPYYYLGKGRDRYDTEGQAQVGRDAILRELRDLLAKRQTAAEELVIHAHEDLPAKLVRELAVELEKEPFKSKIGKKYNGTREAKQ